MIDIHAHILPFVDDGSQDLISSIEMIKESINQGISDIILTPHYRNGYKLSRDKISEQFENFKKQVKDIGININLFLGQEIFVDIDFKKKLKNDDFLLMNNSKFVLIEFAIDEKGDISEIVYELIRMGYIPIIAHFERYINFSINDAMEIKALGGYIQVNADSIVSSRFGRIYKRTKLLFKKNLVDFVASDIHSNRQNYMLKASNLIAKRYGEKIRDEVFNLNAKKIIQG